MKILKVKVKRVQNLGGGTRYIYPVGYDSTKISVLAYESSSDEGNLDMKDRNDGYEYCIGVVKDEDAHNFLAGGDIEELNQMEAEVFGNKYRSQKIKTTDQEVLNLILAKLGNQETLTSDDLKALDPDDPAPGLGKSKAFSVLLSEMLNK